jgi:hypothetical protein
MKILDLKKRSSGGAIFSCWPPIWSGFGDVFNSLEDGSLKEVKRIKNQSSGKEHLMLVRKVREQEGVGALQWDEPPSISAVETVLKAHLGGSIKSIGALEV